MRIIGTSPTSTRRRNPSGASSPTSPPTRLEPVRRAWKGPRPGGRPAVRHAPSRQADDDHEADRDRFRAPAGPSAGSAASSCRGSSTAPTSSTSSRSRTVGAGLSTARPFAVSWSPSSEACSATPTRIRGDERRAANGAETLARGAAAGHDGQVSDVGQRPTARGPAPRHSTRSRAPSSP